MFWAAKGLWYGSPYYGLDLDQSGDAAISSSKSDLLLFRPVEAHSCDAGEAKGRPRTRQASVDSDVRVASAYYVAKSWVDFILGWFGIRDFCSFQLASVTC